MEPDTLATVNSPSPSLKSSVSASAVQKAASVGAHRDDSTSSTAAFATPSSATVTPVIISDWIAPVSDRFTSIARQSANLRLPNFSQQQPAQQQSIVAEPSLAHYPFIAGGSSAGIEIQPAGLQFVASSGSQLSDTDHTVPADNTGIAALPLGTPFSLPSLTLSDSIVRLQINVRSDL